MEDACFLPEEGPPAFYPRREGWQQQAAGSSLVPQGPAPPGRPAPQACGAGSSASTAQQGDNGSSKTKGSSSSTSSNGEKGGAPARRAATPASCEHTSWRRLISMRMPAGGSCCRGAEYIVDAAPSPPCSPLAGGSNDPQIHPQL